MAQPPNNQTVLEYLETAPCDLKGQFINGSNYTFFLSLTTPTGVMQAVYKPVRGENPLWDFPTGSLSKREVAAFLLSEALGWHIVPPTVFRRKGLPFGKGSVQQFINHDPEHHYFNLLPEEKELLRPVVLFDLLINNADRKGSHILWSEDKRLYCIDHGVCFHEEDKVRTVVWDFAGKDIPGDLLEDLSRLNQTLMEKGEFYQRLNEMITPVEISALAARARRLIETCKFPQPGSSHRPYPWPPV
ncbi:MAG: SCO1664 family protein [Chloroflexi bacterium]|nr:SCO1664 family protein [Chloroflexota bacterium]